MSIARTLGSGLKALKLVGTWPTTMITLLIGSVSTCDDVSLRAQGRLLIPARATVQLRPLVVVVKFLTWLRPLALATPNTVMLMAPNPLWCSD